MYGAYKLSIQIFFLVYFVVSRNFVSSFFQIEMTEERNRSKRSNDRMSGLKWKKKSGGWSCPDGREA